MYIYIYFLTKRLLNYRAYFPKWEDLSRDALSKPGVFIFKLYLKLKQFLTYCRAKFYISYTLKRYWKHFLFLNRYKPKMLENRYLEILLIVLLKTNLFLIFRHLIKNQAHLLQAKMAVEILYR